MIIKFLGSITIFVLLIALFGSWFLWSLLKTIVWEPKGMIAFWDALDWNDFWTSVFYPWTRVSRAG